MVVMIRGRPIDAADAIVVRIGDDQIAVGRDAPRRPACRAAPRSPRPLSPEKPVPSRGCRPPVRSSCCCASIRRITSLFESAM